jgi:hypothetical protein
MEYGELTFKVVRVEAAGQELLALAGNLLVARAAFDVSVSLSPRPLIACGAAPAPYPGSQCASAAFHRAPLAYQIPSISEAVDISSRQRSTPSIRASSEPPTTSGVRPPKPKI